MLYLKFFDTSTSNDWLVNSANQMRRCQRSDITMQWLNKGSSCTDTTAMLQHHFLNTVWPSNLQRDWARSLLSYFLHYRMARSEFLFLNQPELPISGALQHFAIIKPRESPWRIGFLKELVLGGDSWDNLQKQFKASSFVSVAPLSLECY